MSEAAERLVLLDRDGVINLDLRDYVRTPAQWQPLPGALEAVADLVRGGFRVIVVSNQAGIGRGLYTHADVAAIHARMTQHVEAAGGRLAGIYYCPHRPDENCECRKPKAGLLRRIEREFSQPLVGVPFIGDKRSDIEAARSVGARPILVLTGYGAETRAVAGDDAYEVYPDLAAAAHALLGETQET